MKNTKKNMLIVCVILVFLGIFGGFFSQSKGTQVSVSVNIDNSKNEVFVGKQENESAFHTYINTIFDHILEVPMYFIMTNFIKNNKNEDDEGNDDENTNNRRQ